MANKISSLKQALNASINSIINYPYRNRLLCHTSFKNNDFMPINDPKLQKLYDRRFDTHSHNSAEIMVCVENSFALQIDDKVYIVKEGDIAILFPNIAHNEFAVKGNSYVALWINIEKDNTIAYLSCKYGNGSFYSIEIYKLDSYERMNSLLNDVLMEINYNSLFTLEVIKSIVVQILIYALRDVTCNDSIPTGNMLWEKAVVLDVKNFISQNHSRPIKLDDIAQEVCVSKNYLNILFKKVTGKTVMQFLHEFKIHKAKYLLVNTYFNINEIAQQLGYYDQFHFSKVFKKTTGISPSEYRNMDKSSGDF